jgi:hypothetical protein
LFVGRKVGAGSDPRFEQLQLLRAEMFTFTGGRHSQGIVGGCDLLQEQALFGLTGNHSGSGFAALMNPAAEVQPESAGLLEHSVAGRTFLGQQRPNLALIQVVSGQR